MPPTRSARCTRSSPCSGIGGGEREDDEGGDRFDDLVRDQPDGHLLLVRAALRHLAPGPERDTSS